MTVPGGWWQQEIGGATRQLPSSCGEEEELRPPGAEETRRPANSAADRPLWAGGSEGGREREEGRGREGTWLNLRKCIKEGGYILKRAEGENG